MTEIEKYKDRILDWKGSCYGDGLTFGECLDALIAAVRVEALEEAALACDGMQWKEPPEGYAERMHDDALQDAAERIRALKGTAPQSPAPPTEEAG